MSWRVFVECKKEFKFEISKDDLETAIESSNYWIEQLKRANNDKDKMKAMAMIEEFSFLFKRPDYFIAKKAESQNIKQEIDFQQMPPNLNADFIIVNDCKYNIKDTTIDFDKNIVVFNVNTVFIEQEEYEKCKCTLSSLLELQVKTIEEILSK